MTIAIPVCDTRSYCKKMLEDLLFSIQAGGYQDKVLIMFDSVDVYFINYFKSKFPDITAFWNKGRAFGFAKNANIGLAYAHKYIKDDGVFLVNMDTILPHSQYLYRAKNKGIAGFEQMDLRDCPALSLEELNKSNEKRQLEKQDILKMSGFCLWISTETMDKIGYLDDGFISSFEDDDICVRAALAGLPVETTNIRVHHYIKDRTEDNITSTGAYDASRLNTSKIRFQLKWGTPLDLPHEKFAPWVMANHVWDDSMKIDIRGIKLNDPNSSGSNDIPEE